MHSVNTHVGTDTDIDPHPTLTHIHAHSHTYEHVTHTHYIVRIFYVYIRPTHKIQIVKEKKCSKNL